MTTTLPPYSRKKVVTSYAGMLVCGIAIVVAAIITAMLFNHFYPLPIIYIHICEYTGYVCWSATLGTCSWDILTWGRKTPAERLDHNLAKTLSIIGIFAFVLARELA